MRTPGARHGVRSATRERQAQDAKSQGRQASRAFDLSYFANDEGVERRRHTPTGPGFARRVLSRFGLCPNTRSADNDGLAGTRGTHASLLGICFSSEPTPGSGTWSRWPRWSISSSARCQTFQPVSDAWSRRTGEAWQIMSPEAAIRARSMMFAVRHRICQSGILTFRDSPTPPPFRSTASSVESHDERVRRGFTLAALAAGERELFEQPRGRACTGRDDRACMRLPEVYAQEIPPARSVGTIYKRPPFTTPWRWPRGARAASPTLSSRSEAPASMSAPLVTLSHSPLMRVTEPLTRRGADRRRSLRPPVIPVTGA